MTQAFAFAFGDDDIEDCGVEEEVMDVGDGLRGDGMEMGEGEVEGFEARLMELGDVLSSLPSSISYTTISITDQNGIEHHIPRRELHDIRTQIMAEDPNLDDNAIAGLSADDITPRIYEGGFKTWECSVDLAKYLLKSSDSLFEENQNIHIVELGAGTALPSLTLFQKFLQRSSPQLQSPHQQKHEQPSLHLTLTDYNPTVLTHATIPNLLLTWYYYHHTTLNLPPTDDLEITPTLLQTFTNDLSSRNIHITAVSGSWGPRFQEIIASLHPPKNQQPQLPKNPGREEVETLLLASETIYSPPTLPLFTETLLRLLHPSPSFPPSPPSPSSLSPPLSSDIIPPTPPPSQQLKRKALVAAKEMYFGVGGGVEEFLRLLERKGGRREVGVGVGVEVKRVLEIGGVAGGVGRCVLEIEGVRDCGRGEGGREG